MSIFSKFINIKIKKTPRKIYYLIGKSGTGKSFRAKLVAEKYNINLIIDDGLLIYKDKILGGQSAKKEKNLISSVKRAIFEYLDHRNEIVELLKEYEEESLLILGTSFKMIEKICTALKLEKPKDDYVIYIENISTQQEIATALSKRQQGEHIIPVPQVELKKSYSNIIYNTINFIVKKTVFTKKIEKTIVKPQFENIGKVYVEKEGLYQMIGHCIEEYDSLIRIKKIHILDKGDKYYIDIKVLIPVNQPIKSSFFNLQKFIKIKLLAYGEIEIEKINIVIDGMYNQ